MGLDLSITTITVIMAMSAAALVQSIAGFGFALVAMPILAATISLEFAAPLLAIAGLLNGTLMWFTYRASFNVKAVGRLLGASLMGIPIGLYGLQYVPESLSLMVLGLVVGGYALYGLTGMTLPKLNAPNWAYGFGLTGGILAGSYNIPGPAVVFYGQCRRWAPEEFKGNLSGYFWFNTLAVVFGHGVQQRLTGEVWTQFAIALPFLLTGFVMGTHLSRYINPNLFRRIVLWLLVLTGIRLIWLGIQALF